jgi:hypothetical protein
MSDLPIKYLLEHKCSEPNCYNFSARGYVLCERCLYGSPKRMDDEDIVRVKNPKNELLAEEI